jgi:hypothetical protein
MTIAVPHLAARPRRLRLTVGIRSMVRETVLSPADFVYPLFVRHGRDARVPVRSMPGVAQITVDRLAGEARAIAALGIPAVILFGIPAAKDGTGSDNYSPDGIVPQAIRAIKDAVPDLLVISDMCFCEYTDHPRSNPTGRRLTWPGSCSTIPPDPGPPRRSRTSGADVIAVGDGGWIARSESLDGRASSSSGDELCREVCQRLLRPVP